VLPWTSESALVAVLVFAIGIGAIAVVLLLHLAAANNVAPLFVGGRLAAPTGYINGTAALFMMGALPSIALVPDRLRVTAAAVLPAAGAAVVARRLLRVYSDVPGDPLTHYAHRAAPV